jgi:hypothetical protein
MKFEIYGSYAPEKNKLPPPPPKPTSSCTVEGLVRAECLKALRTYRAYRKFPPDAFQVWACSEKKGAYLLARRLCRIIKRSNSLLDRNNPESNI